jgi:hypothetical protein
MVIVFLAAPYQGPSHAAVRYNIRCAEALAERLWANGFAVITPHLNSAWFSGIVLEDVFYQGYREILKRCDLVITGSGWRESTGAVEEVEVAKEYGIPVVHNLRAAIEWREQNWSQ